ncbi:MAG: T9SS type A sorting domain-containing protein [Bacteroidales bacterium]
MKNLLSFALILSSFLMATAQTGFEINRVTEAPAGKINGVEKKVYPLATDQMLIDFDSLNMSYAGGWSLGQSFSIASSPTGDTVFIGSGAGVIIMDASDPYNPVKLSEVNARGLVDAIFYPAQEQRLYLAAYFSGLEVWDLSDISSPHKLSRIGTSGLPRGGVYVPPSDLPGNSHAFLVTVANGIDVFEVDAAGTPLYINNQNFTGISNLVWNSCGTGDMLFLAAGNGGTHAIDISVPAALSQAFSIAGNSTSLKAMNNQLFIVNYAYGLWIYNYSSLPATLTGQLPVNGFPYRVSLANNYAYIANSTTNSGGGINIIDASNPSEPTQIADYPGYQTYVAGNSTAVFSTGGTEGCLMLDVTDPEDPLFAKAFPLPLSTNDIAVKGNYAYTGNNGFRVFDISDKSKPVQVGYHETSGDLVKVSGNLAVFCPKSMGANNKVNFMDISDPQNPQYISHYNAPVMTYDLDLKSHYAYVATWWGGIRVIDFSEPQNPVLTAHVMGWTSGAIPGEDWFYCQALDVDGDFLYAVDYGPFANDDTRGLYVFDISNPAVPLKIKRFEGFAGTPYDIEVSNGYAYLADSDGGLSIISVMDPVNPIQSSYLPLEDVAYAVDVFGSYAFVANYINGGVQVINVSVPSMPSIAGFYKRTGCFALNVTYDAGHVFVADGPAGIQIYNFDLLSGTEHQSAIQVIPINLFPNPAKEMVYFQCEGLSSSIAFIELYDIKGMIIHQQQIHAINGKITGSINAMEIPGGVYFLRISDENSTLTRKLIIH